MTKIMLLGLTGIVVNNNLELIAIWSSGDVHENNKITLAVVAQYKEWIFQKINN